LAGCYWLFSLFLPHTLLSALLLVIIVAITGGLHLDGFIDTIDGIAAGHADAARRKSVMKDASVGAIGVIAVITLLLVKFVSLNSLPHSWMMAALVLMPVLSRWAMVYAVFFYPYGRQQGMGGELRKVTRWSGFISASLITLVIVLVLAQLTGLAIMVICWLLVLGVAAFLKSKFNGLTGDTYGAINELVEVLVLIIIAVIAYNRWL
jgi:adenosylcobinamide-GDP ribazoletransferase